MMRNVGVAACAALVGLCICGRASANPLDEGAERYRSITIESIGQALDGARALRDRVAANDLAGARQACIAARAGWERSEAFTAGLAPELVVSASAEPSHPPCRRPPAPRFCGDGQFQWGSVPAYGADR